MDTKNLNESFSADFNKTNLKIRLVPNLTKHSQTPASLFFGLTLISTFIPRSSSKGMRGDLRSDSYVLLGSCSGCVYECVNGSGVGVNAQMPRPEDSRTLTRQRESKRERELNRESQWCRCECANERGQLNAVRVVAEHPTRIPYC